MIKLRDNNFVLFIVLFLGQLCISQLSKAQMAEDFELLYRNITQLNPQIPIREKLMGYSITKALDKKREALKTVKNDSAFAKLIYECLYLCQDGHYYVSYDTYDLAYGQQNHDYRRPHLVLPIRYIAGEYRFIQSFTHKGQTIPLGSTIKSCNGIPIHDYVQGLLEHTYMMEWDSKNKRWFKQHFYYNQLVLTEGNSTFNLEFKDSKNQINELQFSYADSIRTTDKKLLVTYKSKRKEAGVTYFKDDKVLYISLPVMEDKKLLVNGIRDYGKGKDIEKVIIDIRDNPGGSDSIWEGVLKNLIKEPLIFPRKLHIMNSKEALNRYDKKGKLPISEPDFLENGSYLVYYDGKEDKIKPSRKSIAYAGPIYLLVNENVFSSAGSLLAVAKHTEQLVSVGYQPNRMLGFGFTPIRFTLPNSGHKITITPSYDFTGITTADQLLHNQVDIPFEYDFESYREDLLNKDKAKSLEDYLFSYDILFKYVIKEIDSFK